MDKLVRNELIKLALSIADTTKYQVITQYIKSKEELEIVIVVQFSVGKYASISMVYNDKTTHKEIEDIYNTLLHLQEVDVYDN